MEVQESGPIEDQFGVGKSRGRPAAKLAQVLMCETGELLET